MAQLSKKTKRRWLVGVAGLVCILLVAAIAYRMSGETPEPEKETVGGSLAATSPVTITPPAITKNPLAEANSSTPPVSPEVSIQPIQPSASAAPADTAVSQGTEQALQETPVKQSATPKEKPQPKKETPIANPSQKPEYAPEATVQRPEKEPTGGETKDGKIYFPGFGWIENKGGGSSGTTVPDMYQNGNKVGKMGGDSD